MLLELLLLLKANDCLRAVDTTLARRSPTTSTCSAFRTARWRSTGVEGPGVSPLATIRRRRQLRAAADCALQPRLVGIDGVDGAPPRGRGAAGKGRGPTQT